jgi:hypothetical protein
MKKRNKFSLSNYKLMSCHMGNLLPIGFQEVLPGDTFQHKTNIFLRVSPMVAPTMHPIRAKIHHFFVPHRLIWEDFEDFITGGPDGLDASVVPYRNVNPTTGSLFDYLGAAPGGTLDFNILPVRAYNLIWNEFYRDQDLQTELTVPTASGSDATSPAAIQNVCWDKDYFNTSRPWEQKGAEISIPIEGDGTNPTMYNAADSSPKQIVTQNTGPVVVNGLPTGTGIGYWSNSGLQIDVNDFKEAMGMARYQEARARYGSRYTEYLRYLGVKSSDARLQRPEYLGGGKETIQISEVLQTEGGAGTYDDTVGALKGHGIAALSSNRYRKFFEEHGLIMSMLSIAPIPVYEDATDKFFFKTTKEDFFQKEIEQVGGAEILNKEVRCAHATPDGIFGYTNRYEEYRKGKNSIAGEFRTNLQDWHMARDFSSDPTLNSSFVSAVPTTRIYADASVQPLQMMVHHNIQARRMVSKSTLKAQRL